MIPAIQYDLFEEIDPHKEEMDALRDSLRRTQKRFFAVQEDLVKQILRLERENEALSLRLERISKKLIHEKES